jgi:hypothetical protein
MTRLLVLAALAVVLWMFLEIGWSRLKRAVGSPKSPKLPEIPLIRCSGCGVHVRRGQVVAGLCEQCRFPERT